MVNLSSERYWLESQRRMNAMGLEIVILVSVAVNRARKYILQALPDKTHQYVFVVSHTVSYTPRPTFFANLIDHAKFKAQTSQQ